MRSNVTTFALCFLCAIQFVWIWAVDLSPVASAQENEVVQQTSKPNFQVCRGFKTALDEKLSLLNTGDRLTEVGQWVGQQEDEGLVLNTVDFEIAQKQTGYPQGWLYVCMQSRR